MLAKVTMRVGRLKGICRTHTALEPEILIRGNTETAMSILFQGEIPTQEECEAIFNDLQKEKSILTVMPNCMREANFVQWIIYFA